MEKQILKKLFKCKTEHIISQSKQKVISVIERMIEPFIDLMSCMERLCTFQPRVEQIGYSMNIECFLHENSDSRHCHYHQQGYKQKNKQKLSQTEFEQADLISTILLN